jgi:hypothetical protein
MRPISRRWRKPSDFDDDAEGRPLGRPFRFSARPFAISIASALLTVGQSAL